MHVTMPFETENWSEGLVLEDGGDPIPLTALVSALLPAKGVAPLRYHMAVPEEVGTGTTYLSQTTAIANLDNGIDAKVQLSFNRAIVINTTAKCKDPARCV